jgi:ADP-heptose:LPS heptosyltransferase
MSRAKERIGSAGAKDAYVKWKRNLLTDKYYTNLIVQSSENIFEFYRNKEFFEEVLQENISIIKPEIDTSIVNLQLPTQKDFAVIFPGTQEEKRRWSSSNFEIIIEHLIAKYNFDVIIAGSSADSLISRKMIKCRTSKVCLDMTGKTNLAQLAKLISLSKILISNETSAVHFAAAVGTPFVCISNGQRFGRFMPYPKETKVNDKYIYPIEIENNLNDLDYLTKKFRFDSNLDIKTIKVEKVLMALDEIIKIKPV